MSASSSAGSSRSASPNNAADIIAAADRLAQLEKMLAAQMGYDTVEEEPMEVEIAAEDEPPTKKRRVDVEESVAKAVEPAPAEEVAFRLFSTQKLPQTVVIKEAEDDWPSVKDPRIRDVADEEKSLVKERRRAIAALAIDGASIIAESLQQPLSRTHYRVTTRHLSQPEPKAPRPPLPFLAYFKADLPSNPEPTFATKAFKSTSDAPPPLKKRRRPPQPKRQALRRPLSALADVPLLVVPLCKVVDEPIPVAKAVVKASKEKPKGNRRLSKARRDLARKKLGKNAKKNKRKKAKAKAKAQGGAVATA